jgi:broad specificity phosphatase PhoE
VTALRLLAVRHGETAWSRERRFAGARDVPLTERGRRQSEALATALAETALAAVYASPLERACATAEAIAKAHRVEVRVEPEFREMAFGAWEGLTWEELPPDAIETWRQAPDRIVPPGGEPLGAVASRVAAATTRLREAHAGDTVVLVSHAIVIRLLVLAALGLGPERLWSVDASPAGLTEIEYEGGWTTVHRMNTLAHLDALETTP